MDGTDKGKQVGKLKSPCPLSTLDGMLLTQLFGKSSEVWTIFTSDGTIRKVIHVTQDERIHSIL